eukprot:jgi/Ulvmu1/8415/UM042_0122.1
MDLGSFGIDQELEQADRLQQQALQLLQHAARTQAWTQQAPEMPAKSTIPDHSAAWPTRFPECGSPSHNHADAAGMLRAAAEDQAIAVNAMSHQMNLFMKARYGATQIDKQFGTEESNESLARARSGQAPSAAFIMREQAKRIRALPETGATRTVEPRPLSATWSQPGCNALSGIIQPGALPTENHDQFLSVTKTTHDMTKSTHRNALDHCVPLPRGSEAEPAASSALASTSMPETHCPQLPTMPTANIPTDGASELTTVPPHLQPMSLLVSRSLTTPARAVPAQPTQMAIPTHLQERLTSAPGHPLDPANARQQPRSCQSTSTNALHIFSPASAAARRSLSGNALSGPRLVQDLTHGLPTLQRSFQPLAPIAAVGSESGTGSGTPSAATWRSLDHDSSGTGSGASAALSSAAHDFQELLGMYFGLVAELRDIGVAVVHEPSSMIPKVVPADAAKIRAFAAAGAVPAENGAAAGRGAPVHACSPQLEGGRPDGSVVLPPSEPAPAAAMAARAADAAGTRAGDQPHPSTLGVGHADGAAHSTTDVQGRPAVAELSAGVGALMQRVQLLDFTARQMEVHVAAASAALPAVPFQATPAPNEASPIPKSGRTYPQTPESPLLPPPEASDACAAEAPAGAPVDEGEE